MNITKIEEAITLLYQTFIEDQDVSTQRGIAITAMNEMIRLLGGVDVVAKIESVPYSARLRAQHLFEDDPPQRTWVGLTEDERDHLAGLHLYAMKGQVEASIEGVDDFAKAIEAKLKEKNNG
jgi:hypothetical protein